MKEAQITGQIILLKNSLKTTVREPKRSTDSVKIFFWIGAKGWNG
jgi:hypothetical protein